MSVLIYRGLQMKIVHARQIDRQALMSRDGVDYLYTRWTFDVDCVYNPGATTFHKAGFIRAVLPVTVNGRADRVGVPNPYELVVPTAVGVGTLGANALDRDPNQGAVTDASIRGILSRPQGRLIYAVRQNDPALPLVALLVAPLPGYVTDDANGPYVKVNSITQVFGIRTFLISLRIEAYVNETIERKLPLGSQVGEQVPFGFPILLSHRYRQYHDQDADYFVNLVTEGEAVFRTGELYRRGLRPDDFRGYLFPPLQAGFRREEARVVQDETNGALRYRVVDVEEALLIEPDWEVRVKAENPGLFPTAGRLQIGITTRYANTRCITRAEIYHKRTSHDPSFWNAFLTTISSIVGSGAGAVTGGAAAAAAAGRSRATARAATRGALIGTLLTSAGQVLGGSFGTLMETVRVRLWGHKHCNRKDLEILAIALALYRMPGPRPSFNTNASIAHDVMNKMVEFEIVNSMVLTPQLVETLGRLVLLHPARADAFDFMMTMDASDETPPPGGPLGHVALIQDQGLRSRMAVPALTVGAEPPRADGAAGWHRGRLLAPPPMELRISNPGVPDGGVRPPDRIDAEPP